MKCSLCWIGPPHPRTRQRPLRLDWDRPIMGRSTTTSMPARSKLRQQIFRRRSIPTPRQRSSPNMRARPLTPPRRARRQSRTHLRRRFRYRIQRRRRSCVVGKREHRPWRHPRLVVVRSRRNHSQSRRCRHRHRRHDAGSGVGHHREPRRHRRATDVRRDGHRQPSRRGPLAR